MDNDNIGPLRPSTTIQLNTVETESKPTEGRQRAGQRRKKRVAILLNKKIKAYKGWRSEPEPWSYNTVQKYVDWCHIDKLFPLCRHKQHLKQNKANLAHAKDKDFAIRCCQVWQQLYLEAETYRNDNFSFFLVRMVYAEVILKKKVDWTTMKAIPIGHAETASLLWEGEPIDITKMLHKPKPGKVYVPDHLVQWSDTSSSDEHTHEYDNYSFGSDDEDFFQTNRQEGECSVQNKRQRIEDNIIVPPSSDVFCSGDKVVESNPFVQEQPHSGGKSDSKEDMGVLLKKIEQAERSLFDTNEQMTMLKLRETTETRKELLKQRENALERTIEENVRRLAQFGTNRQLYESGQNIGGDYAIMEYRLWQSKLQSLRQQRRRAQKEVDFLNVRIKEREKRYGHAAAKKLEEVDEKCGTSEFGHDPQELATLQSCVQLRELRVHMLRNELLDVRGHKEHILQWSKWIQRTIGKTPAEVEKEGPEPLLEDFLPHRK